MILIGGNLRNLIDNFSNEKLCKSENVGEIEIILNLKKKKVENERGEVKKKYDEVLSREKES